GSEIGYTLAWRNVERVDLALYPIDLTTAVEFKPTGPLGNSDDSANDWLRRVDLRSREKCATFSHETKDTGEHRPGAAELRIEPKLAPGAYILEARAGAASGRELVLVSSSALVVKASSERALVWFTDALSSEPIAGASVAFLERFYDGTFWRWRR